MSNLTSGGAPNPVGAGGRKDVLPVKATTQVYQGGMAAQVSGACVPGTSTGAGNCVGVFESDALGGASDGSIRVTVWTDKIFIFNNGTNAVADSTPYGALLYMEDDHTVGTGGVGGAAEGVAGRFVGFEDDGRVRVFIGCADAFENYKAVNGTALTDTATQTVNPSGRVTRFTMPATFSQNSTVTLGTTGAVVGDVARVVSPGTTAHTLAVANGGTGAGTLATIASGKGGFVQAYFDGTNWLYDGAASN